VEWCSVAKLRAQPRFPLVLTRFPRMRTSLPLRHGTERTAKRCLPLRLGTERPRIGTVRRRLGVLPQRQRVDPLRQGIERRRLGVLPLRLKVVRRRQTRGWQPLTGRTGCCWAVPEPATGSLTTDSPIRRGLAWGRLALGLFLRRTRRRRSQGDDLRAAFM
jgi:hypothetical protein